MTESAQHPFQVELENGTVIGGAQTASDAVTLAAGGISAIKDTMLVRDTGSGAVIAQIGRLTEARPPSAVGPQLDSINPASTAPGLAPQVLTCTGARFEDGATVFWDTVAQVTTFHDATSVGARLDIRPGESGEQVAVQVRNPDGNVSGTVYFTWE
jgi:hypothetical protein